MARSLKGRTCEKFSNLYNRRSLRSEIQPFNICCRREEDWQTLNHLTVTTVAHAYTLKIKLYICKIIHIFNMKSSQYLFLKLKNVSEIYQATILEKKIWIYLHFFFIIIGSSAQKSLSCGSGSCSWKIHVVFLKWCWQVLILQPSLLDF